MTAEAMWTIVLRPLVNLVFIAVVVSSAVREKLEVKHGVTVAEVEECLRNRAGRYLHAEIDKVIYARYGGW